MSKCSLRECDAPATTHMKVKDMPAPGQWWEVPFCQAHYDLALEKNPKGYIEGP